MHHPLRTLVDEVRAALPIECRVRAAWDLTDDTGHTSVSVYYQQGDDQTLVFWSTLARGMRYDATLADTERVTREWLAVGESLRFVGRVSRCGDCGVAMGPRLECACTEAA